MKKTFNQRFIRTSLVIFLWGTFAFGMSFLYYFLKDAGYIWDNPVAKTDDFTWNSRKVIFGLLSFSSFLMMIAQVIHSWDGYESIDNSKT